jgi:hypothetical protein
MKRLAIFVVLSPWLMADSQRDGAAPISSQWNSPITSTPGKMVWPVPLTKAIFPGQSSTDQARYTWMDAWVFAATPAPPATAIKDIIGRGIVPVAR